MEVQEQISPIVIRGLFDANTLNKIPWKAFQKGIQVHPIYGEPGHGPAAALLKYDPGAVLPRHAHQGYEHIVILTNSQHDDSGQYTAGTLIVNSPGSQHRVFSSEGGIVLVIWEKPVRFIQNP